MGVIDGVAAMGVHNRLKLCGDRRDRLIPRYRDKLGRAFRPNALQRLSESSVGANPCAIVGNGTFTTEFTTANRMLRIPFDSDNFVVLGDNRHAAGVVAIAGAGGSDFCGYFWH